MSHVLFAVFGSAGDILPAIAVARALTGRGHRATLLAPPSAALYARAAGLRSITIGAGAELRSVHDPRLFTDRFDGFASWWRTADRYVHPVLEHGYERARTVVAADPPDLVVTHPLAPYGSLLAQDLGVDAVALHLYPPLAPAGRGPRGTRYGGRAAAAVTRMEAARGWPPSRSPFLDRGWADRVVSVHDPAVVAATELADRAIGEPCGFPYWDDLPREDADAGAARHAAEAAAAAGEPLVVATLGSLVARGGGDHWPHLAAAVRAAGARALFTNVPRDRRAGLAVPGRVTCVGFVPLAPLAARAHTLVHHGGIGTTYAGLLAGVPAVVLPVAFDQPFNARLVEQLGVGRRAHRHDLGTVLAAVMGDPRHRRAATALRRRLRSPAAATAAIADVLGERLAPAGTRTR